MNTPEQSVGDLAFALGMLIASEDYPERQPAYECFVESVLVLAHAAGVVREEALAPFDVHQDHAAKVWDTLQRDPLRDARISPR